MSLTFRELAEINAKRCQRWHPGFPNDSWTGADWSNAMCGEAGEAANVVKKLRRHELGTRSDADRAQSADDEAHQEMLLEKLAIEIGDTAVYLDLLAQFYGLSLADCVTMTFNRISEREKFPERLGFDAICAAWDEHLRRCTQCNYARVCTACEAGFSDDAPASHACNCRKSESIGIALSDAYEAAWAESRRNAKAQLTTTEGAGQ